MPEMSIWACQPFSTQCFWISVFTYHSMYPLDFSYHLVSAILGGKVQVTCCATDNAQGAAGWEMCVSQWITGRWVSTALCPMSYQHNTVCNIRALSVYKGFVELLKMLKWQYLTWGLWLMVNETFATAFVYENTNYIWNTALHRQIYT